MRCWNCSNEVPLTPFCRNCGAALPDPETRRAAIVTRLTELSTERTVLEAQLQRLGGHVSAPAAFGAPSVGTTPIASPVAPSAPAMTPSMVTPAPTHSPQPSAPKRLFDLELSPATVVTLIGVVLLAAASFVSAKEHPALVSLSHGTRMIALVVELVLAAGATLYLSRERTTLADAFGALTWSSGLSLGLLATVNVHNGTRHDLWTYSLPFIVGALIVGLARRRLDLTRFVGLGTMAFGVLHLAYFGLNPNVDGYQFATEVSMARGVTVMVAISIVASLGLWTALSPRLSVLSKAEKYLAYVTIALLVLFALLPNLPWVTTSLSGVLALTGLLSIAIPFFVGSYALQQRDDAVVGATILGVVGGLISLGVVASATLGHIEFVTRFPGSRIATIYFPVIFGALALGLSVIALRSRRWSLVSWLLAGVALIPSVGALAATLRYELAGWVGGDGHSVTLHWQSGWFGQGVTVADVHIAVLIASTLILTAAFLALSRVATLGEGLRRTLRESGGVVIVLGSLAVAMRFTDRAASTAIFAVTFAAIGAMAFIGSRFVRETAPLDEWVPTLLLGGGLLASLYQNVAASGQMNDGYQPGGLTMVLLGVISAAGVTTALRRPTTWHAMIGWAISLPALHGISALHGDARAFWQIGLVALGSTYLVVGLTTRQRPHVTFDVSASSGLLLSGAFTYLIQFNSMNGFPGEPFRIALLLLALSVSVAIAQRRGAALPTAVLLVPAVAASLYWADRYWSIEHATAWVVGGAALLASILVLPRRETKNSWATFGPAVTFLFLTTDLAVIREPSTFRVIVLGLGAGLIALIGYFSQRSALTEVGAASTAVAIVSHSGLHHHHFSMVTAVVATIVGVLFVLAATQRVTQRRALERRAASVVGLSGGVSFALTLNTVLETQHYDVALVMASVALLTLAATRRLGANFEARFVLFAGIGGGLVWARGLEYIAAPAAWIIVTGAALLALTIRSDDDHSSWNEWGPALAVTMIPANYGALTGSSLAAALAIGGAIVLVIIGVQLKKRAVFDVAIATFALLSIARLSQVVSDKGRWIVAVIIGLALVANGFWRETRKKSGSDGPAVTSWYRSLK